MAPKPLSVLFLALALASVTPATPVLVSPRQGHHYPPTVGSPAFTLVANVTRPSHPLAPAVHLSPVVSIHLGAGLAGAGLGTPREPSNARVFYTNGTADEVTDRESTLITDGGTPPFPNGFTVDDHRSSEEIPDDGRSFPINLNAGPGTSGVAVSTTPYKYVDSSAPGQGGSFVACNTTYSYYGPDRYFLVVKWFVGADGDGDGDNEDDEDGEEDTLPAECVPIRLLPQQARLNDLPPGSIANHDFVQETSVYEDVATINWSKAGSLVRR